MDDNQIRKQKILGFLISGLKIRNQKLEIRNQKLENLKFPKPTIMFSQKGSWQIKIDDFLIKLNPRDTISIPINSQVNIEINDDEESLLNCVTQI